MDGCFLCASHMHVKIQLTLRNLGSRVESLSLSLSYLTNGHYLTYLALFWPWEAQGERQKKLRLKGRIPHAFERPVDPKKLRAEGSEWLMHWKDQLTWRSSGWKVGISHVFQRPQLTLRLSGWAGGGHQIFSCIHSKDPVKYFIFIRIAFGWNT